jgi:cytochrome c biogenesis protein CcdA/thiol-disulfide isomerase/thioredoxin
VLLLLGIGFLAGVITAISPCVLPVLPILLAGGASGGKRKPYAIIAGLVLSFTVFTLVAARLLDALGLPQDLLRDVAIVLLFLVAATLIFPRLAHWVERPFYALTRLRPADAGGGFVLGLSLGLVFVPCAGPVLAAVTVAAAERQVDSEIVLVTLAYSLGAATPMLAIALGGRSAADSLRSRIAYLRPALGGLVAVAALAIAFGADQELATKVPGYVESLQEWVERSGPADRELGELVSREGALADFEGVLDEAVTAPEIVGISRWLNTPNERPLSIEGLRGRVVVIDFWTYSCINCLRTLPYLKAWDEAYRDDGLTIVGVHTPEFAFERKESNVRDAVGDLGLKYPVALDNDYGTWEAYSNRYWPAKYFIDRNGDVRYIHFGEGAYKESEQVIRALLAEEGDVPDERAAVGEVDMPGSDLRTPETYLGYSRIDRYRGTPIGFDTARMYRAQPLIDDHFTFEGQWRVESERAVAGLGARLRMVFRARDVHLVLSGKGPVEVFLNDERRSTVEVNGDRLYTLLRLDESKRGVLELRFAPGVAAYAFTFG